jgi:hypothetical protein
MSGSLGILLTPVAAAAGNLAWGEMSPRPWSDDVPLLVRPFKTYAEFMFGLAPQSAVYPTYGKVFFAVFLLMLCGLLGLWTLIGDRVGSRGRLGLRLALAGLVLNLFGNISDYWLGYDVLGQPWWGLLFVIGTEIGYLVYMAGSIMLGRALLREKVLPSWLGWLFIVAPPLGIFFLFWGIQHIPSGMVFALSICWLLAGVVMLLPGAAVYVRAESSEYQPLNSEA